MKPNHRNRIRTCLILVTVLFGIIWCRSWFIDEWVSHRSVNRHLHMGQYDGKLELISLHYNLIDDASGESTIPTRSPWAYQRRIPLNDEFLLTRATTHLHILGVEYWKSSIVVYRVTYIRVPTFLCVCASALPVCISYATYWIRLRRSRNTLPSCNNCGYQVLPSQSRCPECGATLAVKSGRQ